MRKHKNFWDKNAGRYDRFMRKDRAAYEEMYALIRPVVNAKTVLELATDTGLIAKHIFYRKGDTTIMIDAGYNYDRLAEKMDWLGIDPHSIRHILTPIRTPTMWAL